LNHTAKPTLLWLFWRWESQESIFLGWPQTMMFPILASQEATITGMNHWCPASLDFLKEKKIVNI
jgi:hypothetical protein